MKSLLLASGFEEFITGNGIWILVGCLAFALLVSVLFLVLNIEKEKKARLNNPARVIKEEKPKERVKAVEVNIPSKEEKVEELVVEEKVEEAKAEPVEDVEEPVKEEESGNYEIRYDADAKEWVVRRENSLRATKRTRTKQEAIDFAKPLAEKHEVKLIVHTKND